jgi:hypothetical protein
MLLGSRVFVVTIYLLLGLSFVAETAVLAYEFRDNSWFTMATHDSHLFLFFPILGTLALAAFYVPSCVFVDMYWRYVKLGRLRFAIGFLVVAGGAYALANNLNSSANRSVWEIAPSTLQRDRSEPSGCGGQGRPCERVALLEALTNVRQVSQTRLALKDFVRECAPDPLLETNRERSERKRFCFASTPLTTEPRLTTDRDCCDSQRLFMSRINTLHSRSEQRSLTGRVHAALLPLKIFFLLVLLAISILLALRNQSVTRHYAPLLPRIEFGVLVGTIAMIFFPLMSQAFVLTADALYGTRQIGGFKPIVPLMSFCFGAWGLLLLLFFYHRRDKQVEMIGKMAGVLASAVAVVKYDLLISFVGRAIGAGASEFTVGILAMAAIGAGFSLLLPLWRQFHHEIAQTNAENPPPDTPEAPEH